jgi:hypothetical protein
MANVTINQLPAATSATLGNLLPIQQGTTTRSVTVGTLFTNSTLVAPILGTPQSGALNNCTGLPIVAGTTGTLSVARGGTGITSFGAGVATFLGTPSSANLAAAVTDETGSGALVFATSPTLVTPTLGVATATSVATGPVFGTVQALSGPGAVNLTTLTTAFTSTATGNALTLADGTAGQLKMIVYVAEAAGADTGILTPTNLGGFTTITFNAVGDSCLLQFIGTDWWAISVRGATLA